MLKHVLLAGAVMISVPALAQTAPTGDQTKAATPTTSTTAPKTAMPPAPTAPQPADPASPATSVDATTPVPATPAAAEPAAPSPSAQIADVVGKEFPSYDKNSDGKLSKAEFGSWMFALRKANDPALTDDAANKKYVTGAFLTADTDKSKAISKDELTNYLVQGQAAAQPAAAEPATAPGAAQPAPAQPAPATPAATPPADPAPAAPAPTAPQPDK